MSCYFPWLIVFLTLFRWFISIIRGIIKYFGVIFSCLSQRCFVILEFIACLHNLFFSISLGPSREESASPQPRSLSTSPQSSSIAMMEVGMQQMHQEMMSMQQSTMNQVKIFISIVRIASNTVAWSKVPNAFINVFRHVFRHV